MGRYRIHLEQAGYDSHIILQDIHLSISWNEFCVLAGKSGCGKTTFLRLLKKQLHTQLRLQGTISIESEAYQCDINDLDEMYCAAHIGYVAQQPDAQLVSDEVWHELAFGLENLGMESELIHQRIAEVVAFLGLEDIYHVAISKLSGGQKQLVNLASVLAMRPDVILLDEPVSQLDPIAKQQFYDLLLKIHHAYDIGIFMIEHTLEPLLAYCDRVLYMEKGHIVYDGTPQALCTCHLSHPSLLPYPARYVQTYRSKSTENPLCEKEMRKLMQPWKPVDVHPMHEQSKKKIILSCKHLYFRYQREDREILKDFDLALYHHEILCLLGGNGSGKTTVLRVLSSVKARKQASIKAERRVLYLPQDPRSLFLHDTLDEEYAPYAGKKQKELIQLLDLHTLLAMHPYDLSGGEIQRAALGLLLMQCEDEVILLLDEPSKGLDMFYREQLAHLLKQLTKQHTILMVSHDVEFAALCADRCGLLFDARVASLKPTVPFFQGMQFYTTYWQRCTFGADSPAITYEDVSHET